ncbi:acyl-CoA thioesterase [Pontibacter sp. JAM-7]|uniref:acyl-CoA thioesterase n=1 Tax=Pontibacter sp. JAM-7 TaxID=3366581 RepID=UPI003AF6C194
MSFSLEMKVRDYECDLQGIVNNGVYFNYLEHARHEFLLEKGIDFAALTAEGVHLVVVRSELDYKQSLTSGDRFSIAVSVERISRVKFGFRQRVVRLSDQQLVLTGLVTGVALNPQGRPCVLPALERLLVE